LSNQAIADSFDNSEVEKSEENKQIHVPGFMSGTPSELSSPARARSEETTRIDELATTIGAVDVETTLDELVAVEVVVLVVVLVVVVATGSGFLALLRAQAINLSSVVANSGLAEDTEAKVPFGNDNGIPITGKLAAIAVILAVNSDKLELTRESSGCAITCEFLDLGRWV